VVSDHGAALRERGYEGHARVVYRESTEVPFMIRLPFALDPGVVVGERTRNVDVWPTVLDLLGLEPPGGTDGRSRVPDIVAAAGSPGAGGAVAGAASPEAAARGIAHLDQRWGQQSQTPMPMVAVTEGPLRYVRTNLGSPDAWREELFDAAADPAELDDLSGVDADAVERLRAVADDYLGSRPEWGTAPTRELGELELHQLRALGYAIP